MLRPTAERQKLGMFCFIHVGRYAIIYITYATKEKAMSLDLFAIQSFPNQEEQKEIIDNYFNVQLLWLDIKEYCAKNNISEQIVVHGILGGFFEQANKDFREMVRRFNNAILYLRVELLRFAHYYKLCQECKENEHKKYIKVWVRYEARCVCNEIFMYEEKIKNLLRNLFLLDAQKTRRNENLMKELEQISKTNSYLKNFCLEAKKYYELEAVKFVTKIRNDEIHNESRLDEYTDRIQTAQNVWCITNPRPVIKNDVLYNEVKNCLNALLKLKIALQTTIDNFSIQNA